MVAVQHVITLDPNTLVAAIECPDEHSMSIRLHDVRAAEFWRIGSILAGTLEVWQCRDHTGKPHPFARELRAVRSVSMAGETMNFNDIPFAELEPDRAYPAVVTLATQEAGAHACFERLHLNFYRTPGPFEAEIKEAARTNATLRRELGFLDFVSSTVSTVATVASAVASGVSQVADVAANGGAWSATKTFER